MKRFVPSTSFVPTIICLVLVAHSFFATTPLSGQATTDLRIELTADESQWLADHDTIRVAGPKAFPPFHYFDEDGTERGIATEYIAIIGSALGITIEYMANLPWPEVLSGVKNGTIDLVACAAISEEREAYMSFTRPFLSFPMVVITKRDAQFLAGLDDLNGQRIAVIENVTTYSWLLRDGIVFEPYFVSTPLEALNAVSTGEADAYLGNLAASTYLIEKNGLANLKVASPTTYGNYDLHMAARKDWPILASLVDKTLSAIPVSERTSILNRWILVRYEHGIRPIDVIKWILAVAGVALCVVTVILLWNRRLQREITQRKEAEAAVKKALAEVQTLSGLVPICASCKNIRDDSGYWTKIEEYVRQHSQAQFSHGICPECAKKLYPDFHLEE
jgi:ABC-type amino acid transport substrate-binding protein